MKRNCKLTLRVKRDGDMPDVVVSFRWREDGAGADEMREVFRAIMGAMGYGEGTIADVVRKP